jgi:lipopolysaccharide export system protein LptC
LDFERLGSNMAYVANHMQASVQRPSPPAIRRNRAIKSAQRHSRLVRLFKSLFPLTAFGVSTLYLGPALIRYIAPVGVATIDAVEVSTGNLKMIHPHYSGAHPTYGAYNISAETATQKVKSTEVILLDQILADVVSPSKETTTLTAPDGVLRTKEELLFLNNGAVIVGSNGLWANLRKAEVAFKTRIVTTHDPVEIRLHDSVITSDSAIFYTAESRVEFTGSVHLHLLRDPNAPKTATPGQQDQPQPAASNHTASLTNQPAPAPEEKPAD